MTMDRARNFFFRVDTYLDPTALKYSTEPERDGISFIPLPGQYIFLERSQPAIRLYCQLVSLLPNMLANI